MWVSIVSGLLVLCSFMVNGASVSLSGMRWAQEGLDGGPAKVGDGHRAGGQLNSAGGGGKSWWEKVKGFLRGVWRGLKKVFVFLSGLMVSACSVTGLVLLLFFLILWGLLAVALWGVTRGLKWFVECLGGVVSRGVKSLSSILGDFLGVLEGSIHFITTFMVSLSLAIVWFLSWPMWLLKKWRGAGREFVFNDEGAWGYLFLGLYVLLVLFLFLLPLFWGDPLSGGLSAIDFYVELGSFNLP